MTLFYIALLSLSLISIAAYMRKPKLSVRTLSKDVVADIHWRASGGRVGYPKDDVSKDSQ